MDFVALRHVESSWISDQTCVPCISRWILTLCTTREVSPYLSSSVWQLMSIYECHLIGKAVKLYFLKKLSNKVDTINSTRHWIYIRLIFLSPRSILKDVDLNKNDWMYGREINLNVDQSI